MAESETITITEYWVHERGVISLFRKIGDGKFVLIQQWQIDDAPIVFVR